LKPAQAKKRLSEIRAFGDAADEDLRPQLQNQDNTVHPAPTPCAAIDNSTHAPSNLGKAKETANSRDAEAVLASGARLSFTEILGPARVKSGCLLNFSEFQIFYVPT
jgi:hypothetical protein